MKTDDFFGNLKSGEKYALFGLLAVAAVIVFGSLFGLLVQYLWNATLVELLGVGEISFWQSIGVLVLAKLFFGFGSSSSSSKRSKKKTTSKTDMPESKDDLVTDVLQQDEFREYWQREGRAAFDAFRAGGGNDESPKPS